MLSLLKLIFLFSLTSLALHLSFAQDGSISGPTTDTTKFTYSCDPNQCKLPHCNCASTSPPGGLAPSDVPMFLVFTADDAIQSYTINAVNNLLQGRKNPNGCPVKMTYYTSINYTNFTTVTDFYVAGNEVADHTMTHVPIPEAPEINGNLIALNTFAGIPLEAIKGFRAPFLNFSAHTLELLAQAGFTYDSSATSSVPVTDPHTDAFWPYTLDNGLNNNCLTFSGICNGEPKIPGFWEVPMYAQFDRLGAAGIHLMDPWLDTANGETKVNDTATLEYLKDTFNAHYTNMRQPMGLYTHPIHIAIDLPGVPPPNSTIDMIKEFLDYVQLQQNVWIVSTEQLLEWVRNPIPISQLDQVEALKCPTPVVSQKICNGMPQNEAGLLVNCPFSDFPWFTCYGCPVTQPSPGNPNPSQQVVAGQQQRFHLPANCSTAFWDPVAGKCLCQDASCRFEDGSRPIGPNGENLTSGAIEPGGVASSSPTSYVPFTGNGALSPGISGPGVWKGLVIATLGALVGGAVLAGRA